MSKDAIIFHGSAIRTANKYATGRKYVELIHKEREPRENTSSLPHEEVNPFLYLCPYSALFEGARQVQTTAWQAPASEGTTRSSTAEAGACQRSRRASATAGTRTLRATAVQALHKRFRHSCSVQ